jgi:hypothetical protein
LRYSLLIAHYTVQGVIKTPHPVDNIEVWLLYSRTHTALTPSGQYGGMEVWRLYSHCTYTLWTILRYGGMATVLTLHLHPVDNIEVWRYGGCTHVLTLLYSRTHTAVLTHSHCTYTLCAHTILILYSYCTHTALTLYSCCTSHRTHTVPILCSHL